MLMLFIWVYKWNQKKKLLCLKLKTEKNKEKSEEGTIDINKSIRKFVNKKNSSIYYNKNCFVRLHYQELYALSKILVKLYTDYLDNKNNFIDYKGIKHSHLDVCLTEGKYRSRSLKTCIWMLIPHYVEVKSYGHRLTITRRYKITKNGILLVERMQDSLTEEQKEEQKEENECEDLEDDEQ